MQEGEQEFELIERGRYSFPLLPDDTPLKYQAKIIDLDSELDDSATWPDPKQFYMVSIRDFVGDKALLFEKLKDKKVIPNPIRELQQQEGFTFIFASLGSERIDAIEIGDDNTWEMKIGKNPQIDPKRIWVLFPLTEKEATEKAKEFNTKDRDDIPKDIRAEGTIAAGQSAVIDLTQNTQWIELPDQGLGLPFSRKISLGNDLKPLIEKVP